MSKLTQAELAKATFLVANGGADLTIVKGKRVMAVVGLPAGINKGLPYVAVLNEGEEVEVGDGMVAMLPSGNRTRRNAHPETYDTGANPDFQPTSATAQELEMRKMLKEMRALSKTKNKRAEAFAEAAEAAEDAVIDDETGETVKEYKKRRKAEKKAAEKAAKEAEEAAKLVDEDAE